MTRFLLKAIPAVVLANLLALPANAALMTFTDRPTFDAAAPGLALEDFEAGNTLPGLLNNCGDVMNSTTTDDCFDAGELLPGISYSFVGDPPSASSGMVAIGAGFLPGITSTVIGPTTFVDDLDIMLTVVGGANAIGFDIIPGIGSGDLDVEAFGAGGSLGVVNLVLTEGVAQFVGFVADEPITQILLSDLGGSIGELIDDVAFGNTLSVPEPTTLALLGLGLIGAGVARRRRV